MVKFGVPPVSVIGTVIFLIYINDLHTENKSEKTSNASMVDVNRVLPPHCNVGKEFARKIDNILWKFVCR